MKTEGNMINNLSKSNLNSNNFSSEFISYINTLSDSIKEYFKVTKNTIQNKNILIESIEKEFNSYQSLDNDFTNQIKDSLLKLKINIDSDEKNLKFFFDDAKIIFKKMKDIHKNLLKISITKQRSYIGVSSNSNRNNYNTSLENPYQQSEIGLRIKKNIDDFINKNNNSQNKERMVNSKKEKPKTVNIKRENKIMNNLNLNKTEENQNIKKINNNNKYIMEIEKLKNLIKTYELNIKKLNLTLKKYRTELNDIKNEKFTKNDQNDDSIIQEELTLNKDKVISSLKDDLEKTNKKNMELMNNFKIYQIELKKLSDENNKLKKQKVLDKNLSNKFNNLIKENNSLKSNIANSNNNNKNLKKEIDILKRKINIIGKKLNDEKNKNYELVIETNDKCKKLENMTMSLNSMEGREKQMLIESIKSIFSQDSANTTTNIPWNSLYNDINKILDNYMKENEQLKLIHKKFEETLLCLENQLNSNKSEFTVDKNKLNMEMENISEIEFKDYSKTIEETDSKNKQYFNILQENNNKLIDKVRDLNQEKAGRCLKIYKLEIENKELKKNLDKLNNIKNSNIIMNDTNDSILKNHYNELNKKYEEQKQENNELKEKMIIIKTENEQYNQFLNLGTQYIPRQDIKASQSLIIEELNNQIKQLKNRNETLNDLVETYTSQFWNKFFNKNEGGENYDKIKDEENEKIDELNKKNYNSTEDKEKYDKEIKLLKRENEKLTNQIIRLSKNLPEEYNDLQKQYNDLESKYKQLIKNKSNNNNNIINNNINNININNINNNGEIIKILNEIKEIKKENELIKKKNLSLVAQLEEKEIKKNCFDNKSENAYLSNYEEEFDLRKMAKGVKEKNRSQDINIDYPGIQNIKEKYRELDFYYNALIGLVKKLLLTIQVNVKNKTYVKELCKIVGFDLETTNEILNNKAKNLLLGLFQK